MTHCYAITVRWTGNKGVGTRDYRAYDRDHDVVGEGKASIEGSSDPHFRGNAARWNPEELLVASLAACHQLWYLHLCAINGIVVTAYDDAAQGYMEVDADGGGHFTNVVLRPRVAIAQGDSGLALRLHEEAARLCFIARSVNFSVTHEPVIEAS